MQRKGLMRYVLKSISFLACNLAHTLSSQPVALSRTNSAQTRSYAYAGQQAWALRPGCPTFAAPYHPVSSCRCHPYARQAHAPHMCHLRTWTVGGEVLSMQMEAVIDRTKMKLPSQTTDRHFEAKPHLSLSVLCDPFPNRAEQRHRNVSGRLERPFARQP